MWSYYKYNLYIWCGLQWFLPETHEKLAEFTSCIDIFNLSTGKWKESPTTGNPPLGVTGYASAVIDNDIIYFSGWCAHRGCYHNSIYSLNVDTLTWKELSPTNPYTGPMMKSECGMVPVKIDEKDCLLIICGKGPSVNTPKQKDAEYIGFDLDTLLTNEHHYYDISTGKTK